MSFTINNLGLANTLSEKANLLEFYSRDKKLEQKYYLFQFKDIDYLQENQKDIEKDYFDNFLDPKKITNFDYFEKAYFEILINQKFNSDSKNLYFDTFLKWPNESEQLKIACNLYYNWVFKALTEREIENLKKWVKKMQDLNKNDEYLAIQFFDKTVLTGKTPKSKKKLDNLTNKLYKNDYFDSDF